MTNSEARKRQQEAERATSLPLTIDATVEVAPESIGSLKGAQIVDSRKRLLGHVSDLADELRATGAHIDADALTALLAALDESRAEVADARGFAQMLVDSANREAEAAEARATAAEAVVASVRELADTWMDPDPERGDPDKAEALFALLPRDES